MPGVHLFDNQYEALEKLSNGKILNGDTGSGKSITGLAYYYTSQGGRVNTDTFSPMKKKPLDLYIITTPLKRDKLEWDGELRHFMITRHRDISMYQHNVIVDSWHNIKKYVDIKNAFFLFDEQRVIGYGTWAKSFIKIAKNNKWILLTATPGDSWSDYIPVFIANGFYRNKTDFERRHVVWSRYTKFPKVERYVNQGILNKYKNDILIKMPDKRHTMQHHEYVVVDYNKELYSKVHKDRWNVFLDKPLRNASEYCYALRKVVNSDPSRVAKVMEILKKHPKAVIFYNFNYELELLRKLFSKDYHINVRNKEQQDPIPDEDYNWLYLVDEKYAVSEWNGHKHEPIKTESDFWTYLVQYTAGAEGWNCVDTDTIIFFSQNYSYRIMHQSGGRIDRLNTPFTDLYYYHLRSNSRIDMAIRAAYTRKKKFNERGFAPIFPKEE